MLSDLATVLAVVGLPFLAAAVTPLAYRALGERTAYFASAVALACFGLVASLYLGVQADGPASVAVPWFDAGPYAVALRFYVDGLALLVAGLASGVGVLVFTYSREYMRGEPMQAKYYATLLAFMGSMLGVALAADFVALFVFWELTSVASFVLIGHYSGADASQYAARKAMVVTVGGGLFMLAGFLLVAAAAGTFALAGTPEAVLSRPDAVRATLEAEGLYLPVLALVALGAAAKSAQVPLHLWLPDAMEAPTPVSAFLHSATMVKAGVYLVGRVRPFLLGEGGEWTLVVATLGLVTMAVTAVLAVAATDIKELLAYSTASHLGLIVAGFGFSNLYGAEAGVFHVLNHAAFKAALFLVAGIVAHEAGTRRLHDLRGLRHDLPVTAVVTGVAALGMAGVPPFNGFYSKELLFEAAYEAGVHHGGLYWLFPAVAVLGSVFTFLYSVRFLAMFLGEKPESLGHVHSPPLAMLAPPVALAAVAAGIGAAPQVAVDAIVQLAYDSAAVEAHEMHVGLPSTLKPAVVMSAVTIAAGLLAYPFYDRLHAGIRAGLRGPARANWWYHATLGRLETGSATLVRYVQNGLLRTYATWAVAALTALTLGAYVAAGVTLPGLPPTLLRVPVVLVLLVAIVAVVAVTAAPSHVAGVLTLSILGFMVAIFYILASAPDLALTQLVVETLTLVIFLLVLDKLPAFYGSVPTGRKVRDAALSLAVGATVTVTVLLATGNTRPTAGDFPGGLEPGTFAGLATEAGGGTNVVNVILVDFRGLDTLGEISVVAMAGLSVLTLIAMREGGETQ